MFLKGKLGGEEGKKKNREMPQNQISEKAWELSGEEESTFYIILLLSFNHHPSCCRQQRHGRVMAGRWEIHGGAGGTRAPAGERVPAPTAALRRKTSIPCPGLPRRRADAVSSEAAYEAAGRTPGSF